MGKLTFFFSFYFLKCGFFLCFSQEYEKALKYIRILLKNEPGNNQAIEMEKLINQALKKGLCVCVSDGVCVVVCGCV